MDCKSIKRYVSAFLDGELDQNVVKDIEQHLVVCKNCQLLVQAELGVKNLLVASYRPEKAPFILGAKIRQELAKNDTVFGICNDNQKTSDVMEKSLQLKIYPDTGLREISVPVNDINEEIRKLIDGMVVIMYSYNGIGLAAPQVGVLQRMFIADTGDGLIFLANPEIVDRNGEDWLEERCLSLPDIQVNVKRNSSILVRGINSDGNEIERELSGLNARVVEHEVDHLNGVLIIDQAPLIEKYQIRKALKILEMQSKHSNKSDK